MGFGGFVECKFLFLIFKILPMLMECSILLMGNTVEMAGGDIYETDRWGMNRAFTCLVCSPFLFRDKAHVLRADTKSTPC